MFYTDPYFVLFQRTGSIIIQNNTHFSVSVLDSYLGLCLYQFCVSTTIIPSVYEIPTPGHINFINYNLIPLKTIFDAVEDTLLPYPVYKIIDVFLL